MLKSFVGLTRRPATSQLQWLRYLSSSILHRKDEGAVARLLLNNPKTLNCLSDAMMAALQSELDDIATQQHIRCVVLAGSGKAFCAGHDLKEMAAGGNAEDGGEAYTRDLFDRCSRLMLSINRLPQPVLAQVHGVATAAGCQLVATCDMVVAAETTKFGVNGVDIGLFCSTPMVALSRNIPRKVAFEMLTTGEFISSKRALEVGLVNTVVPDKDLTATTEELAQKVAGKFGKAIRIGKEAFYKQLEMPLDQAYGHCGEVAVTNMMFEETKAGIDAFLRKEKPEWNQ